MIVKFSGYDYDKAKDWIQELGTDRVLFNFGFGILRFLFEDDFLAYSLKFPLSKNDNGVYFIIFEEQDD